MAGLTYGSIVLASLPMLTVRTTGPRALLAMLAFAAALVAVALTGLAHAQERPSPEVPALTPLGSIAFATLDSLPVAWVDRGEDPAEREARLTVLAAELANAVDGRKDWDVVLAAAIEIAWAETRLSKLVSLGRCEDMPAGSRCDPDPATGEARARGYFQLWEVACRPAYEHPAGSLESLREETRCAVKLWSAARVRCRGRHPSGAWAGGFSGYRAKSCDWPLAKRRADHMRQVIHARILAEVARQAQS